MAAQRILHGTWDEIAAHADEFRGRQLTLIVNGEKPNTVSEKQPRGQ
jgi:hypothetical protein